MVVVIIEGVVKLALPDNRSVPPNAASYQSMVSPLPGVAVIVTGPVPHLLLLPAVGAEGKAIVTLGVPAHVVVTIFSDKG